MSLKYKVSLLISLLFVVSGLASALVNRLLIIPSFVELERQAAYRNVERAIEAFHRDLDVLSTNVTAWAWWDDSKLYMEGKNDEFVEAELSAEPVASAEVSYMGFYRTNGTQVIHSAPAVAEAGSAGLGDLQAPSLPKNHPLLQHADLRGDAKGLVSTPSGPMFVASRPILTSSGEGPAAGVLIFGRLLDPATVKRIAGQYKLDLTITPALATQPIGPLERSAEDGPAHSAILLHQDESITTGETTIADLHGKPILTLRVLTPRAISAYGEQASRIALAILCAVALAVLAVLLSIIHVTVLRPIGKLTAHAVDVGNNDALDKRLKLERTDELGVLAAEFDRMTDRLVEARRRLIEQSFVSGKADMAAGILHNLGNAVTPITVRLNTLTDRMKAAPLDDLRRAVEELESKTAPAERQADLIRFVQLAGRDLAVLMRDAQEDVRGVGVQIEHVQQILAEQERYSHAGRVVEAVDMERVIQQATGGLGPELQRAVTLDLDPSVREIGAVRGARVEIQQIVSNLIINAAESIRSHSPAGGRIAVRATREEFDGVSLAHFLFEDNGAGIQPWHLKRIFDRRFSTKDRGSGVGLHWSANAVAALGGRLFAESPGAGKGARLHLLLPLAEELSAAAPMAAAR
ncbi:MAG: CHASE4 domain-containing protein [Gammaproteobacteria bacterium]